MKQVLRLADFRSGAGHFRNSGEGYFDGRSIRANLQTGEIMPTLRCAIPARKSMGGSSFTSRLCKRGDTGDIVCLPSYLSITQNATGQETAWAAEACYTRNRGVNWTDVTSHAGQFAANHRGRYWTLGVHGRAYLWDKSSYTASASVNLNLKAPNNYDGTPSSYWHAGASDAGSTTTEIYETALDGDYPDDFFNGWVMYIHDGTSWHWRLISDYAGTTAKFTLTPALPAGVWTSRAFRVFPPATALVSHGDYLYAAIGFRVFRFTANHPLVTSYGNMSIDACSAGTVRSYELVQYNLAPNELRGQAIGFRTTTSAGGPYPGTITAATPSLMRITGNTKDTIYYSPFAEDLTCRDATRGTSKFQTQEQLTTDELNGHWVYSPHGPPFIVSDCDTNEDITVVSPANNSPDVYTLDLNPQRVVAGGAGSYNWVAAKKSDFGATPDDGELVGFTLEVRGAPSGEEDKIGQVCAITRNEETGAGNAYTQIWFTPGLSSQLDSQTDDVFDVYMIREGDSARVEHHPRTTDDFTLETPTGDDPLAPVFHSSLRIIDMVSAGGTLYALCEQAAGLHTVQVWASQSGDDGTWGYISTISDIDAKRILEWRGRAVIIGNRQQERVYDTGGVVLDVHGTELWRLPEEQTSSALGQYIVEGCGGDQLLLVVDDLTADYARVYALDALGGHPVFRNGFNTTQLGIPSHVLQDGRDIILVCKGGTGGHIVSTMDAYDNWELDLGWRDLGALAQWRVLRIYLADELAAAHSIALEERNRDDAAWGAADTRTTSDAHRQAAYVLTYKLGSDTARMRRFLISAALGASGTITPRILWIEVEYEFVPAVP